eukprot:5930619-Prymnesium_polylepis.1
MPPQLCVADQQGPQERRIVRMLGADRKQHRGHRSGFFGGSYDIPRRCNRRWIHDGRLQSIGLGSGIIRRALVGPGQKRQRAPRRSCYSDEHRGQHAAVPRCSVRTAALDPRRRRVQHHSRRLPGLPWYSLWSVRMGKVFAFTLLEYQYSRFRALRNGDIKKLH